MSGSSLPLPLQHGSHEERCAGAVGPRIARSRSRGPGRPGSDRHRPHTLLSAFAPTKPTCCVWPPDLGSEGNGGAVQVGPGPMSHCAHRRCKGPLWDMALRRLQGLPPRAGSCMALTGQAWDEALGRVLVSGKKRSRPLEPHNLKESW